MEDSLFPSIVELADERGLRRYGKSTPNGEVRVCCPFCLANVGKEDKEGKLYLSPVKKTFRCFRCGENGGVVAFLAKLDNKPERVVLDEFIAAKKAERAARRTNNGTPRKKASWENHPAMKLNTFQWQAMGFISKVTYKDFRNDPEYARRTLQWAWQEWQAFVQTQIQEAFKLYCRAIYYREFDYFQAKCKELEERYGIGDLWVRAERVYRLPCRFWPEWAVMCERHILEFRFSAQKLGDYHYWIQHRRTTCQCKRSTDPTACKSGSVARLRDLVLGRNQTNQPSQVIESQCKQAM